MQQCRLDFRHLLLNLLFRLFLCGLSWYILFLKYPPRKNSAALRFCERGGNWNIPNSRAIWGAIGTSHWEYSCLFSLCYTSLFAQYDVNDETFYQRNEATSFIENWISQSGNTSSGVILRAQCTRIRRNIRTLHSL